MDLFGDDADHWDHLTPSSNTRPVHFFNERQRSAAGHGGSGGGGLDLNSQAVAFPDLGSYSALLQGDAGVDSGEGATRGGRGYGRPGNNQGAGRGVAPAMATDPSRFPPMGAKGGRGGRRGGGEAPDASEEGLDEEEEGFVQGNEDMFDKANWNAKNTIAFCDICIEEISAGNTSNGKMTSRAHKNMEEKYMHSTGLHHSKTQLKNRWDQLKKLYAFWLWLNKQTGNGAIFYDDNFWKKHAKGKTEWKRMRYGPLDCLHQLERMFANTAVDGLTACIPGEHNDEDASTTLLEILHMNKDRSSATAPLALALAQLRMATRQRLLTWIPCLARARPRTDSGSPHALARRRGCAPRRGPEGALTKRTTSISRRLGDAIWDVATAPTSAVAQPNFATGAPRRSDRRRRLHLLRR